ncbi:MAG: patatin-like phospholipase family protein [bacterium]
MPKYKRKLHLALGGGGARGLAHIGVLKVIEQERLPIGRLSGTSGGAIIAALYAQTGRADKVYEKMQQFLKGDAFREFGLYLFREEKGNGRSYWKSVENLLHYLKSRLTYSRVFIARSIFSAERFVALLSELYEDGNLEDCRYPLQIAAVNVDSGEDVLIDRGNLTRAVAASAAIPGLIAPVEFGGKCLIDGAVINAVPLLRTNRRREVPVAVDVSRCVRTDYPRRMALDYIFRAEEITTFRLNEVHLKRAEILIRPQEVRHGHWADFSRIDEFVQSGARAAEAKIAELKDALHHRDSALRIWLQQKICVPS